MKRIIAVAAVVASLGTPAITQAATKGPPTQDRIALCQFARGSTSHCVARSTSVAGFLYVPLRRGRAVTWLSSKSCVLVTPRVDGFPGEWNRDHDLLRWPQFGVTFNGITFGNAGHRSVTVSARCPGFPTRLANPVRPIP